jgi:REP element-mobilizing transposase RayT
MARQPRPHLPGVPFHLTARAQGPERIFVGLERQVARLILTCAGPARMRIAAYAVMPNHLHIVAIQGTQPLGWYMHTLLRRAALLVMRSTGSDGHVFRRRYFAAPCADAAYFRTAVMYVNLNPLRAALCAQPGDYEWSSQRAFETGTADNGLALEDTLRVFAISAGNSLADWRADYLRVLNWRLALDRFEAQGVAADHWAAPLSPWCRAGDDHWRHRFAMAAAPALGMRLPPPPREDLTRITRRTIAELAPDLPVDMLRLGSKSTQIVRVRQTVIARALTAGHTSAQIGRYLRISSSSVSRVAVAVRHETLP